MGAVDDIRRDLQVPAAPTRRSARRRARHLRRQALSWMVVVMLVAVWAATLRPTVLGGPATFVVVRGTSMEPTFHAGDLIVMTHDASYAVGEVIAYRPSGTGAIVIHRVVRVERGRYVTRGDNRDADDPWHPTASRIVGRAWVLIPRAGAALWWFGSRPAALAALCGTITAVVVIGSPRRPDRPGAHAPTRSS